MILFSSLNQTLFGYIHSLVGASTLLDGVAIFCASYLQYVIMGVLHALIFCTKNKREHIVLVTLAILAGFVARLVVKPAILLFFAEPRPFVFLQFTPLISTSAQENLQSFPSGHALFFFALAMVVFMHNKKHGTLFFVAATLMGMGRVYTGVHWPMDIIFGAGIGIMVGFLVYQTYVIHAKTINTFITRIIPYTLS